MKRNLFVLGTLFLCSPAFSQPALQWAKQLAANTFGVGHAIAVDNDGNVYTTGNFQGTVDFDPGPGVYNLVSAGGSDVYISKLDAAGNFVWAKRCGGSNLDASYSIAVNRLDEVYVTGYFEGTGDYDPGAGTASLTSSGSSDVFILKLDASGNYAWAHQFGGGGEDNGYSVAVTPSGDVYVVGDFCNVAAYTSGSTSATLTTGASQDVFILKLNSSSGLLWAKQIGNTGVERGRFIKTDLSGNIYITGYFSGTVDFDLNAGVFNLVASATSADAYVVKYDASGALAWAKAITGPGSEYVNAIDIDLSGNVLLGGSFEVSGDFDPGPGVYTLTCSGTNDGFVLKLGNSGDFVWAKRLGGTGNDTGQGLAVDAYGNVYTTGFMEGTVDLDPGIGVMNFSSSGYEDIFISKLDSGGNYSWGGKMGGAGYDTGFAIDVDTGREYLFHRLLFWYC